ncbi:NAD-dependent epimerase/dehydratase family protein [Flagellimonas eckloniae]|nr:NAD-dependent epimerase/dehydratase family protein [Allomuricauda eckloniae]
MANRYFYSMILVTGGTGLIGSHLLFRLVKNGKNVKASYRNKDRLQNVLKVFGYYTDNPSELFKKIDWVQADLVDIGSLELLFDGVEYVYHCAAMISFDPSDYPALVKNNSVGTANIVNQCLERRIKKLCYVSSIATIGPSAPGKEANEENEWNDTNISVYGLTKQDAELEVWRGSQEGLSVVIVNPGVVLGPGFWKSGSGSLFTYASKGKKSFIPGGTGFVTISDVASSMVQLMESKIEGERFILVNENLTYQEILQKIAPNLGSKAPIKRIPFWVLECFWRLDWLRSKLFGKSRKLTKSVTKGLYKREIYTSEKIIKALGFKFENLDSAIGFCCSKFKG